MKIEIRDRFRPFSHVPGTKCYLPGSLVALEIFPCLIRVHDLSNTTPQLKTEIQINLKGPIPDFTIIQDLEKGATCVLGNSSDGFIRYWIRTAENGQGIHFHVEKAPEKGISFTDGNETQTLKDKESWTLFHSAPYQPYLPPQFHPRLSLGNHKAQDMDLIRRRKDLTEIAPLWTQLHHHLPQLKNQEIRPAHLEINKPEFLEKELLKLFLAGFEGLFSPRLIDTQHQGLYDAQPPLSSTQSPLSLISEGAHFIESLLFSLNEKEVSILPHLPPQWHCGRLINIPLQAGTLSFEWSKKCIRRMVFHVTEETDLLFHFKKAGSFRFRKGHKDRGIRYNSGTHLHFEKNSDYYFDNFQ